MGVRSTNPMLSKKHLYDMYVIKKMSQAAIAKKIGVGKSTVISRMQEYGIPAAYNGKSKAGRNNPNWKGISETPCDNCGKPIGRALADRGVKERNYCSRKCSAEGQKKNSKIKLVCPICQKDFLVIRHDADKRKFCSRRCADSDPKELNRKSELHKGKTIPEWHRQALSKAIVLRSVEKQFSYGKSGYHISPKAGDVFYRSSYEKKAYEMLDADKNIISYQPEPFSIDYHNAEGKTRRYRPDILVNKAKGKTTLIEVKPEWKLKDALTILKLDAGKNYAKQKGWRFEVWTEKKLKLK